MPRDWKEVKRGKPCVYRGSASQAEQNSSVEMPLMVPKAGYHRTRAETGRGGGQRVHGVEIGTPQSSFT